MKISDVNRGVQKNKKRMRVGRGPGSGKGRTAGRGNKGQGQLAGWSAPAIFEGGRMPIIRQIPKRGFNNRHGLLVAAVNVDDLDASFASGAEVSPATIKQAGLAKGIWHELKILGDGKLTKALKVSAHHFSAQARQKIEAAGGTATELPGAAPVEKGKKKAARKKPTV
ncbi:MAG: 50S ribosomal protein L15 [Planctomycetia bacterium]|nr:50S ribosomal protein L15 [Planctomycetia bacterium]